MTGKYSLQDLVADLTQITGRGAAPEQIILSAKPLLARFVSNAECIAPQYKRRGTSSYGRYMLHRAPFFNITSVVWGPGDTAKAHNHQTWGLVGVVENELQETRFRRLDDGSKEGFADLELAAVNRNTAGMVSSLLAPRDDIHAMLNVTARNTVEVHIYGKDLANLQRLQFDVAEKRVKHFASPRYDNC